MSAIKRKPMNRDSWQYSRVIEGVEAFDGYELDEDELPIFEIKSDLTTTLISTRRILERTNNELKFIDIESIDDVIYGNFKGTLNEPTLSKFRIVDLDGRIFDF